MTFLLSEMSAALTMVKIMMIGDNDIATGDDDHDNCVYDHTGHEIDDDKSNVCHDHVLSYKDTTTSLRSP